MRRALLRHAALPRMPLSVGLASFYRFLLSGFKSFNSLFRVLFIFPSQYLFAIGFPSVFSLRRSLSPAWSFNPKKLDSLAAAVDSVRPPCTGISPSVSSCSKELVRKDFVLLTSRDYNSPPERRFSAWAFVCSVAPTKTISVDFFSSA